MTAPVTSYTTTDAVRSCMGVTDNEMSDEVLHDMGLSITVIDDLESWLPDHTTNWSAFKSANPTATEIKIGRAIPLYCAWAGAASAWNAYMAVPQDISDGKSYMKRFATDTAQRALLNAQRMSNKYKSQIEEAIGTSSYSAASVMGKASPSFDPITGTAT